MEQGLVVKNVKNLQILSVEMFLSQVYIDIPYMYNL